jgi:uncharacterized membrane protein
MNAPGQPLKTPLRYRIHWHVWLIHFPISFFLAAFVFQFLHLFPHHLRGVFEVAGNVMIIGGTVAMIQVTWTGWRAWKREYKGAPSVRFSRKILLAFAMLPLAGVITLWRTIFLPVFEDYPFG